MYCKLFMLHLATITYWTRRALLPYLKGFGILDTKVCSCILMQPLWIAIPKMFRKREMFTFANSGMAYKSETCWNQCFLSHFSRTNGAYCSSPSLPLIYRQLGYTHRPEKQGLRRTHQRSGSLAWWLLLSEYKRDNSTLTLITSQLWRVNHSRQGGGAGNFWYGVPLNRSQWQQQVSACAHVRAPTWSLDAAWHQSSLLDVSAQAQTAAAAAAAAADAAAALKHVFVIQSFPSESGDLQNTEGGVGWAPRRIAARRWARVQASVPTGVRACACLFMINRLLYVS